jgi:hypothetical protein
MVCSTKTLVSVPPTSMVGRKVAGLALVEVRATNVVLSAISSSAWTTTA